MKTKITIFITAISLFANVIAQEVWYDVNFSSDEWVNAFVQAYTDGLLPNDITTVAPGSGTELAATNPAINDFLFNGNVFQDELAPFASVDGVNTFKYCVRMRNNNTQMSYIQFPTIDNIGKVTVYVRNPNAALSSSTLDLAIAGDTNDPAGLPFVTPKLLTDGGGWRPNYPWHTWDVPAPTYDESFVSGNLTGNIYYDEDGACDMKLEYDVNLNQPVDMRICRQKAQFMQIYRIVIEKYTTVPVSTQSSSLDKIDMCVNGKILALSGNVNNAGLSIFDLVGKPVFNGKVNSNEIDLQNLNAGIYIIKLIMEQGEVTRKVIIY